MSESVYVVPLVDDSELLTLEDPNLILLASNRNGGFIPPLIKIDGELRRVAFEKDHQNAAFINRISPPTNIPKVIYGRPSSTKLIVPEGSWHVSGLPINYIFLDDNGNEVGINNLEVTFPPNVGEKIVYSVYPVANGSGPLLTFSIESTDAIADENELDISQVNHNLPNIVHGGWSGSTQFTFTELRNIDNESITLVITNSRNITFSKTSGITNGELLDAYVHNDSIGKVIVTYHYRTPSGKRTADKVLVLDNNFGNTVGSAHSFIQNFPQNVGVGDIFNWSYGGVLPGTTVLLSTLNNVSTNHTGNIYPGTSVPFQVTGSLGEVISIGYVIMFQGTPVGGNVVSSIIGPAGVDVSSMVVSTNTNTIQPGDQFIQVTVSGIPDATAINLVNIPPTISVDRTTINNGETFSLSVTTDHDHYLGINIPILVTSLSGTSSSQIRLPMESKSGEEAINISRIFKKPAGVTSLTVVAQAGLNYADTILTGLITYVFEGELGYTPERSVTFNNLDPDEDTITFTLAPNTVAKVTY